METVCSHQDVERKAVGGTAHFIAYIRNLEAIDHPKDALVHDPYANALAGAAGKRMLEEFEAKFDVLCLPLQKQRFRDAVAVRTKVIDDHIVQTIEEGVVQQVLVFGAGLCTRPWRLSPNTSDRIIHYFEIDFQEIFNYKIGVLQEQQAIVSRAFEYHSVSADLSLSNWTQTLIDAGYDPLKPTIIVMEGFVNYLYEHELRNLLQTIDSLCPAESRMILTCMTPSAGQAIALAPHRYFPEDPLFLFLEFDWKSGKQDDIEQLAAKFGRATEPGEERAGYMMLYLNK
jgi:methyltransferase (TIGR00027 family)